MAENQEPEKQVFNMSLSILDRISKIQDYLAQAGLKSDFPSWASGLRVLRRQVSYKFTAEEKEDDTYFWRAINILLPEFKEKMVLDKKTEEYYLKRYEDYEDYGLLNGILEDYEEFLMGAMDRRDMLTAAKEDRRKAVGDMN